MLFTQVKNLALSLTETERLRLLDLLKAKSHSPLIRSARLRCFELLLAGRGAASRLTPATAELDQLCHHLFDVENGAYTPGDLFCADDCVLFLLFAEAEVSAGLIYSIETLAPLQKLDRFCHDMNECLMEMKSGEVTDEPEDYLRWQTCTQQPAQGLAHFIATQPTDFAVAAKCRSSARAFVRAAQFMEERAVRVFLRRVQEMRREGYSPRRLFAEADRLGGVSVATLFDAGLLEREVRVSCRQSGHALFDLPSPDSLTAITISKAKCSQCAAPVVDEVIEETFNPTPLAVALLEDGGWLNNRVYQIIRSLGVPDSEIATGPVSDHGEYYLAVSVCGSSFLFVTKDGDLTPAFSRRIAETVTTTEVTHLVVVITGVVEDEGQMRLYEFIWRRARDGQDLDVRLIEGLSEARAEIGKSFERVMHRELSRQLCTLDRAFGLSASNFVLNWFKLLNTAKDVNVKDMPHLFAVDFEHTT